MYTHHHSILCNYFKIQDNLIELFDGHYLERAQGELLEKFKYVISQHIQTPIVSNPFERYVSDKSTRPYTFKNLDQNEWQYWGIKHRSQYLSDPAKFAIHISEADFNPILILHHSLPKPNTSGFAYSIHNHAHQALKEKMLSDKWDLINAETISETKELYYNIKKLDKNKFDYIFHSMNEYVELRRLHEESPFKVLGLIAILENILTDGKLDFRSINHQLHRKIVLINNRFSKPLNFSQIFKGSDTNTPGTIINKIYDYRSKIAHGGIADFEKEIKVLGNQEKVFEFLNKLVKRTFCLAVAEPQLIFDLKKC